MNAPLLSLVHLSPASPEPVVLDLHPAGGAAALMLIAALVFAASGARLSRSLMAVRFDGGEAGPQFVERNSAWLGYGIRYHLGVDGI
ncbi:MAG: hypothetical protein MZV70_69180 [Desulfobacterales bacterium]|nr:hypothetical protein [Desulfobacterales bacterium]